MTTLYFNLKCSINYIEIQIFQIFVKIRGLSCYKFAIPIVRDFLTASQNPIKRINEREKFQIPISNFIITLMNHSQNFPRAPQN